MPRYPWPLGIIIQVQPGKDGLVRTVTVKTKSLSSKRRIHKLVLIADTYIDIYIYILYTKTNKLIKIILAIRVRRFLASRQ